MFCPYSLPCPDCCVIGVKIKWLSLSIVHLKFVHVVFKEGGKLKVIVSYCPAQILPLFMGPGAARLVETFRVSELSLLGGGVEWCLLQVGGSSITIAESHLGYLEPDHQALS